MNTVIIAKLLDQIGLLLGFISGLLLIPEVINFLPLSKLQKSIENQLHSFDNWTKGFPQKLLSTILESYIQRRTKGIDRAQNGYSYFNIFIGLDFHISIGDIIFIYHPCCFSV